MAKIFKIDGANLVITDGATILADTPKRDVFFINEELNKGNIQLVSKYDSLGGAYLISNCQNDNSGSPVTFTESSFRAFARLNLGKTEATGGNVATTVNVKNYGAVGDGITDDTAAIQACVTAQPNNTTINFGDGNTYLVGAAGIAILNKTGIKLTGRSIIKYTAQSALVVQALGRAGIRFTTCTKSGVDGIIFDGNSIVQAAIGFDNCLEEYVSNCEVYGCASAVAQLVSAKAVKCTYNNNIVRNAGGGSCRGMWIGNLTIAEQATNVNIYNNRVFSNTATGIVCTSVGGIVYGNNVYSNAGSGIIFSGGNGLSAKNIVCNSNICTDNLFYGIQSDVVYTVDADLIVDININGNNCSRNNGGGILMTHSTRLSVVGNTCNDNNYDNVGTGGGIECDNHTYNAIISGNTCSDTRVGGARTQSYGVRCVANTFSPKMISISNNICENNTSIGIYAESTGVLTITDLSIIGNTCNNNSSRGIFLNEAVAGQITSTVTNNRCSGNTTTDMRISALNVLLANNVLVTQQDVRYFDFPALATTPTVGARSLFRANNASATTITNFLSPYEGQEVSVLGANANTTLAQGTFQLKGAVNILIPSNGIITLQYQAAVWREKSRSF